VLTVVPAVPGIHEIRDVGVLNSWIKRSMKKSHQTNTVTVFFAILLIFTIWLTKFERSQTMKVPRRKTGTTKFTARKYSTGPRFSSKSESASLDKIDCIIKEARQLPETRGNWKICEGLRHLASSDGRFVEIIKKHGIPATYRDLGKDNNSSDTKQIRNIAENDPMPVSRGMSTEHFHSLLKIIIYQQLSAKSADPIFCRFLRACGVNPDDNDAVGASFIQPEQIQNKLFSVSYLDGKKKILYNGIPTGLSESKASYIQHLVDHFLDANKLKDVDLSSLDDEELRNKLLDIKGLGPWSVDMFMLFDLHRSDVLPVGDLGVRRGIALLHGRSPSYFESKKAQLEIETLCAAWRPYASLATCYMWKLTDDTYVGPSK